MITKAEAAQIDKLLTLLVREIGMNVVAAVEVARESLAKATEGRLLPKQLATATKLGSLPKCAHNRLLLDWGGEQHVPPCGCRLVEPTGPE